MHSYVKIVMTFEMTKNSINKYIHILYICYFFCWGNVSLSGLRPYSTNGGHLRPQALDSNECVDSFGKPRPQALALPHVIFGRS